MERMINTIKKQLPEIFPTITIIFTSITLSVLIWFFSEIIVDESLLSDEGFVFYGSWRVLAGEIPYSDFRSYDPLRYYWVAGWMAIFGTGIISFYQSLLFIKSIAIACSLWIFRKVFKTPIIPAICATGLALWMFPRYKIFEIIVSIIAVIALYNYLTSKNKNSFILGLLVGVFALIGINVGVYSFVSFLGGIIFTTIFEHSPPKNFPLKQFLLGIPVGYSPIIIFLLSPNFLNNFISSVKGIIVRRSTNLALPVPWPWLMGFKSIDTIVGILFLAMPVFFALGFFFLIRRMWTNKQLYWSDIPAWHLFVAALFVGFPYIHYAFSRADLVHLSLSIAPFWIGLIAFSQLPQWKFKIFSTLILVLFLSSTFLIQIFPSQAWALRKNPDKYIQYMVKEDKFFVEKDFAELVDSLLLTIKKSSNPGDNIYMAPNLAMIYYLLDIPSPTYDTYPLVKPNDKTQFKIIDDFEEYEVNAVMIDNFAVDGLDERRFSNHYYLLWKYLQENFQLVETPELPSTFYLFRKVKNSP